MANNTSLNEYFFNCDKVPRILSKIEGKGNEIKTVIINVVEIAKVLCVSPIYFVKYFGRQLGAQTKIDVKNDLYNISGAHDSVSLQKILDEFIRKRSVENSCF